MSESGETKIETIFHQALEKTGDERERFLLDACEGDAALLERVEGLLRADRHDEGFLHPPPSGDVAHALRTSGALHSGERIGSYRVIEPLGSGGMGTVYLAERADGQFEQNVAVKVIRSGSESEEILSRFHQERQTLARLNHPHIARLLDGGVTDISAPFFVMEYIEGANILKHCNQKRLAIPQRMNLFLQVCEAVSHAHRNLVIHRDIKPSNILVSVDGAPKLLDFGIAKVLRSELGDEAVDLTGTGGRVMTVDYASPEQIRGEPVTTATDVYSLTVVLYELLSGVHPFRKAGRLPYEIELAICEEEPTAPSTRISESKIDTTSGSSPKRVQRMLSGDLDTIVLRGLKKHPRERYSSVDQLADDLRRFLAGLPIKARRDTTSYRLRKFVQRQKLAVTLSVAICVLGLTAVVENVRDAAQDRESLAQILRLTDLKRLSGFIEEERRLFPAEPDRTADMENWLGRAEALAARLPLHERTLREKRNRASDHEEDGSWEFPTDEEQWEHDTLSDLVGRLTRFADPNAGTIARVRRRLDWANRVHELTVLDYEVEWDEAIASIADPEECPAYGGLELRPQLGIIPLGRDEHSGFWEFGHLQSGNPPDLGHDGWIIQEETGLVFVLLPGRAAQGTDSPGSSGQSSQLEIKPFFLSKYEMTQAQWIRTGDGSNPSAYQPGFRTPANEEFTLVHPVESLSAAEADRRMLELGLELPPGEHWTYACQGGTENQWWWTGNQARSLEGAANLVDATAASIKLRDAVGQRIYFDDGFILHAPVAQFRPNPFGLYNVVGNVDEFTRACRIHIPSHRPQGSWEVEKYYCFFGGGFSSSPLIATPGGHSTVSPDIRANHIGLRPMRRLETD